MKYFKIMCGMFYLNFDFEDVNLVLYILWFLIYIVYGLGVGRVGNIFYYLYVLGLVKRFLFFVLCLL